MGENLMGMSKNCKKNNPFGIRMNAPKLRKSIQPVCLSQNISKRKSGRKYEPRIGSITSDQDLARCNTEKMYGRQHKAYSLYVNDLDELVLSSKPVTYTGKNSQKKTKVIFFEVKMGRLIDTDFYLSKTLFLNHNGIQTPIELTDLSTYLGVSSQEILDHCVSLCSRQ
jgi:hypothetical protein